MKTGYTMSPSSRKDYLRKIPSRSQAASRSQRRRSLDGCCATCGSHRQYAIRLLHGAGPGSRPQPALRRRGLPYGPQVLSILPAVWEAAPHSPWPVRRKALRPGGMPWIRRRFRLSAARERQRLSLSLRSIDDRWAAPKRAPRRRLEGRTQPGILLQPHIPVKTGRWDVRIPGFPQIDRRCPTRSNCAHPAKVKTSC